MSRTRIVAARYPSSDSPTLAGTPQSHPRGLYVICATVGPERFSFFLLSAILVLYLNEHLGVSSARAIEVYGYFLCGCYVTPLLGGRLCDGYMGYCRTALLGGALQFVGYLLFFADRAVILYGALALMALGGGLFKAGTQALLGSLYAPCDSRRDRSFSVFYAVVNVGALCAPLVGGWTLEHAGWPWSFAVASLGAMLSVSVLALGHKWVDRKPTEGTLGATQPPSVPLRPAHRQLVLVLAASMVFAVGVVQSHSSLLLWARDRTERHIGSFEIPVAWFAAAPAALVLLVAPVLTAIFSALRRGRREPSTLRKIAIGLAVSGLAFVPLWLASTLTQGSLRVSPLWVLGCMTMLAIGELLVPALAPSEITRITPPERRGRMLSYWFVAMAAGNVVGGWVHF